MKSIIAPTYTLTPSDSPRWVNIESLDGLTVDTEIRIFGFRHKCQPTRIFRKGPNSLCSILCCYGGCYAAKEEITQIENILTKIIPDLQADALTLLKNSNNQICDPEDYDEVGKLYKIRCAPAEWEYDEEDHPIETINSAEEEQEARIPPENHCIFLMENGYCAIHKHYLDIGENWYDSDKKFNICTTFPLDIRPQDNTIAFMEEIDDYLFSKHACISNDEELKKELHMPYIIQSMKEIIVERYSLDWWEAFDAAAKDWRAKKIKFSDLYTD